MKKVWAVLLLLIAAGQVYADEGMWVLKELNKQNLARMQELGFVPSYKQLYSETDPCVANAVVILVVDVLVLPYRKKGWSLPITIVVSVRSSS